MISVITNIIDNKAVIKNDVFQKTVVFDNIFDLFEKKLLIDLVYYIKNNNCTVVDIKYKKGEVLDGTVFFKYNFGRYNGYVSSFKISDNMIIKNMFDFELTSMSKKICFKRLIRKEAERYTSNLVRDKGYLLLTNLEDIEVLNTHTPIKMMSKYNEEWSSNISMLHNGAVSPMEKKSKTSFGERAIGFILHHNNIDFKYQHSFRNKEDNIQYMDFYIKMNGRKICLEYNGEQHYRESYYSKQSGGLKSQKYRDKTKKDYCADNNIEFYEIKYDENNILKINKSISKLIGINLKDICLDDYFKSEDLSWGIKSKEKEILDYYMENSAEKTGKKFNVSSAYVSTMSQRYNIKKKPIFIKTTIIDKNNKEYIFRTMADAQSFLKTKGIPINLKHFRRINKNEINTNGIKIFFK